MDRTTLENCLHKVLIAKGCCINWGRPFQVDKEKDRGKAVEFIIDSIILPLQDELDKVRLEAMTLVEDPDETIKKHLEENLDIARTSSSNRKIAPNPVQTPHVSRAGTPFRRR